MVAEMPISGSPGFFLACVDSIRDGVICGTLHSQYRKEPVAFTGLDQLVELADGWMDEKEFPQADFRRRGFFPVVLKRPRQSSLKGEPEELRVLRSTEELQSLAGQYGEIWFHVLYRHNGSWQGKAGWISPNTRRRDLIFRSTLELALAVREAAALK